MAGGLQIDLSGLILAAQLINHEYVVVLCFLEFYRRSIFICLKSVADFEETKLQKSTKKNLKPLIIRLSQKYQNLMGRGRHILFCFDSCLFERKTSQTIKLTLLKYTFQWF